MSTPLLPPGPQVEGASVRLKEAVEREAAARLRGSPYRSVLRRVECEWSTGVLVLRGAVPTYYHKQLAQSHLAGLTGVALIDNRLQVTRGAAPG